MPVRRFIVALLTLLSALQLTPQAASRQPRYPLLLVRANEPAPVGRESANADRPCNLVVPAAIRPVLQMMWERSPTFRLQCARIGTEFGLVVELFLQPATSLAQSGGRAVSRITRDPAGRLDARVYLASLIPPAKLVEFIAHELEHIVEQLDGVELDQIARRAPATVWQSGQGAFETARAVRIGLRVAADVEGD